MNTGSNISNINFDFSTNTSNTNEHLNTGNSVNTSNLSTSFSSSPKTTSVETMDLSAAVAATEANKESIISSIGNWFADTTKSVFATGAVVTKSITNGVANIGEGIVDGITWCGGKVVEGASFLGGKVAGWFSDETEQSVMEWREQVKTDVKEFISTDLVGEADKKFYENTSVGNWLNENSYLKYDSKAIKAITTGTEVVGKIAAATGATILTGGVAAPLILGLASGTGTKSEKLYQENINPTGAQELGVFISGLGEAANWYALGKLGSGALTLINTIKTNGIAATGATAVQGIKSVVGSIKANGVKETLKGIISNGSITSMMAADNLADSAGIIGDNVSDWLVGDEQFNLANVIKATGELGAAWILNMGFDAAGNYLLKSTSTAPKTMAQEIKNIDTEVADCLAKLNPNSADYSTKVALIEERASLKRELLNNIHSRGTTMEEYVKYCGQIAEADPQTKQLIKDAATEVHNKAVLAEPTISELLKSMETDGVYLSGFDHRYKSVDSIGRKITNLLKGSTDPMDIKMYAAKVNDNLRYTLILDDANYTDQMYTRLHKFLDEGYEVIGMNNSWGNSAYQGLNVSMLAPEGVRVEVQFHTDASFTAKEKLSHSYYEIKRSALAESTDRDIAGKIQILDQSITVDTIDDLVGIPWRDIAENAKTYGTTP